MENQNDQAFEADQDVNAFERLRPSSTKSRPSSHRGYDTLKAAFGTFESQQDAENDSSPLLGRDRAREHGSENDTEIGEGDGRPPPTWDGERDFEDRPWWKTPSVFWLLPPFAVWTMAFGGVVVPRLNLILNLICRKYYSDRSLHDPSFQFTPVLLGDKNPQCRNADVQDLAAKFSLYGSLISGLLAAIISPKLGALSDRYGRTRLIAVTGLGMLVSEIITILVATYPDMLSVNWILLGWFFDGLGGSFTAAMALAYAYASDCTIPEKRNVVFGYYHASLFAGIALGPILAGLIVKATGHIVTVFYIAFGLHSAFFLFLLFVVPDSLSRQRQLAAREKRKHFVGQGEAHSQTWLSHLLNISKSSNVFAPLTVLWPTGPGTNPAVRRNLVLIAAVDTTMFGVAMGSMTVVLLYSEFIFGWDTYETSVFVSIANTCRVITLVVLLPTASRLLRGPAVKNSIPKNSGSDYIDLGIIRTAIFFDLLGYIGYTLARTGPVFILSGAVAAIGGMGSPTLQAALTKHAPQDKTGQILGAMGLLHASARIVAPTIFNLIYAKTVGGFSQTVFVCLAATFGVAFCLSWFIRAHVYWDQPTPKSSDDADEGPIVGNGDVVG